MPSHGVVLSSTSKNTEQPLEHPVVSVENLKVSFSVASKGLWNKTKLLRAVNGVSFDIYPGQTLGLVGESGCGKSTLGRAILGLIESTQGDIKILGHGIHTINKKTQRQLRQFMQIIFQDPLASLDPRMTVGQIVAEPLNTFFPEWGTKKIHEQVIETIQEVGLHPNMINRYPHEFSGGQCQRIGIARAMILRPKFVVCDEPVSALDVSIQAQIVNLLMDLQQKLGVSYLFISHNLSVVRHIAHHILVLYLGKMMELTDRDQLYFEPLHPYTKALISAVPLPDPIKERNKKPIILNEDIPSPLDLPSGCVFHTRCPLAKEKCKQDIPDLLEAKPGHWVACHFWEETKNL